MFLYVIAGFLHLLVSSYLFLLCWNSGLAFVLPRYSKVTFPNVLGPLQSCIEVALGIFPKSKCSTILVTQAVVCSKKGKRI